MKFCTVTVAILKVWCITLDATFHYWIFKYLFFSFEIIVWSRHFFPSLLPHQPSHVTLFALFEIRDCFFSLLLPTNIHIHINYIWDIWCIYLSRHTYTKWARDEQIFLYRWITHSPHQYFLGILMNSFLFYWWDMEMTSHTLDSVILVYVAGQF